MAGSMKIGVKPLRDAMNALSDVVERRSTVPILSDVLVRASAGAVTMVTTDLDLMLEVQVSLEEPGTGAAMNFCVSADMLKSIAAKLPVEGIATIAASGNTGVTLTCGRSRFQLPTLDADDFPVLGSGEWDNQFEMAASELGAMIDAVRFAISTEEMRYYLNGIYCHAVEDQMIAAATDGHRLAKRVGPLPDGAEDMPGIIVSRKTVGVVNRLLDGLAVPVDVAISSAKIQFAMGATTLTAKLIDGTFPDYNRVIPAANSRALWFGPAAVIEAVERVLVLSSDKTRVVKMDLSKDILALSVRSPENGVAEEEVPVQWDGDDLTIGFNGSYLLDVLRHLNADTAQCLFGDPATPTLWRDGEDAARTYVLMPFRV